MLIYGYLQYSLVSSSRYDSGVKAASTDLAGHQVVEFTWKIRFANLHYYRSPQHSQV